MDTSFLTSFVPIIAIFGIMYFLMIRPQQQRVKQHREMVDNVRRGDTVVTAGGIVGKVAKVKDDAELMVDIAENVQVRVLKSTLRSYQNALAWTGTLTTVLLPAMSTRRSRERERERERERRSLSMSVSARASRPSYQG